MSETQTGPITQDGCPVVVYRQLVNRGEAEFIDKVIGRRSRVLDLGAGTGRIADALVNLGHDVIAVDNSAEMLAAVQRAQIVLSDIETYRGAGRFDAVVLASHLVNTPDLKLRQASLHTVAENLDVGGTAFIEWHPPDWFDHLVPHHPYTGTVGAVVSTLEVASIYKGLLRATVTYELDDDRWTQTFTAQRLKPDELEQNLHRVGLELISDEPIRRHWVLASPRVA